MRLVPSVPILVALALILPGVAANDCTPTTSEPHVWVFPTPVKVSGEVGPFYVQHFNCIEPLTGFSCEFDLWLYQESNGMSGLQRQDEVVDDTCSGQIAGDTVLF